MSNLVRTPVVDVNGKETHVWRSPEQIGVAPQRNIPIPAAKVLSAREKLLAEDVGWEQMPLPLRCEHIYDCVIDLLTEHEIHHEEEGDNYWYVNFNNNTHIVGKCDFHKLTIYFSRELISAATYEQAIDVALHEVAHAIAGPYARHGEVWKEVARSLGMKDPGHSTSVEIKRKSNGKTSVGDISLGDVLVTPRGVKLTVIEFKRTRLVAESPTGDKYSVSIDYASKIKKRD